jgi:hypothetical protein
LASDRISVCDRYPSFCHLSLRTIRQTAYKCHRDGSDPGIRLSHHRLCAALYLSQTLAAEGQAPNPVTQGDCQIYQDFAGLGMFAPYGQLVGQGCVYPTGARCLKRGTVEAMQIPVID